MIIYELRNGRSTEGFHRTLDGAKQHAQERLDEYREFYADFTPEELEDTEPLIDGTLEWTIERIDPHGLPTDLPGWGFDTLIARYGTVRSFFAIYERQVGP